MSGNTLGKLFTVTTFGESHGAALGAVVDGCPPGLPLTTGDLQVDLDRRKPGQSRYTTQRRETDEVEILSGVFEGQTTGTSIQLMIENTDQRSRDYGDIAQTFRPGHADITYHQKYGHRDYRGGGRSSARETAARVAAGGIARAALNVLVPGIEIKGYMTRMGEMALDRARFDWDAIDGNDFWVPDADAAPEWEKYLKSIRKAQNSVGAEVEVVARGLPAGLGAPVYGKLDTDLAAAMMSINAVKGVEIGAGFDCVAQRGTEHSDEMSPEGFLSNEAGGVLGGISTGQDIMASVAIKPTSSIRLDRQSIDLEGNPVTVNTHGRHDPCVGIRATPIVESMLAIVLMDHALRHRGQNADVICETPKIAGLAPTGNQRVPSPKA